MTDTKINAPSLAEATGVWAKIGLLSFGGPAAQIALMHRLIVEEKGWLSEKRYLSALSFCMLLPGPEAMQLATYAGWRLHGVWGGLIAGLLFVLPGALVILILASIYAAFGDVPFVEALFLGIQAAVLAIVIEALLRVAKKALHRKDHWLIAGFAFVALFVFDLSYPLVIAIAGVWGFSFDRAPGPDVIEPAASAVPWRSTLSTIAIWLLIWWAPLLTLQALTGPGILVDIGYFFSKLAIVTFGGAYAVLAYMAQDVVADFGWLTAGEMLAGLGLAETTPGPLILVTEFVAFLAAFKEGGFDLALAGALVALWVTFTPCFLWIFAGAPYLDQISANPRLRGALSAITAAVVGVILNLSVWFALHVLFAEVERFQFGALSLWQPTLASIDWRACFLAVLSGWLLLGRHWSLLKVLPLAALGGLLLA